MNSEMGTKKGISKRRESDARSAEKQPGVQSKQRARTGKKRIKEKSSEKRLQSEFSQNKTDWESRKSVLSSCSDRIHGFVQSFIVCFHQWTNRKKILKTFKSEGQ